MPDLEISAIDILKARAAGAEAYAYAMYQVYAGICKEAGYAEAGLKLEILADNEKEHFEQWVKQLNRIPEKAMDAMQKVVEMEHHDAAVMYTKLKAAALETGDTKAAELAQHLIDVESRHEAVIGAIRHFYDTGEQVKLPGMWVCTHCGNFYLKESDIPEICPVCEHPRSDYVFQD